MNSDARFEPGSPDDHPGVVTLPPLLWAGALAAGLLLHVLDPRPILPPRAGLVPGGLLVVAGVALALWAERVMDRAGTNVHPRRPATAVVADGPFRFSRNPMYLALSLAYLGIAAMVNALWIVLLVVPFLVVLHWGVILREERYLDAKFGDDYRRYRARVRRWL